MMQRSYNLPSCSLNIEGISTSGDVLSILTNFGCRFNHHPEPITGGLDLLKSLIKVVGAYAQALSSNTSVAIPDQQVRLEPEGKHLHILSVSLGESEYTSSQNIQIKLNTIQLFDLMEGLDRLCCDSQTLTDLKLITHIDDYRSQSPMTVKAMPAIAGVLSVAIASAALYLIPVPKPDPKPVQTAPTQPQPLPTNSPPTATPESSPKSEETPQVTPEATTEPSPESSPESTSSDNPSPN
ncbi:MAG: hypothetical protein DCE90_12070 [Pseudanabaena sp.]|nr:MAG: hypothetical protein DCE90_12070 [Pseudanabaena sp.]